jgi:pimeloyl-ACP methyl ester carboxylesterase
MSEGIAQVNGVDLYCQARGAGPPLVLIAGLASDSQSWIPVIPALAGRFTVIAYDNRGVGRTAPRDAEITVSLLADDCASLVGHLGYSKVDLIGHSMGGFVAQLCAARYPELVDRLVLVGTASSNSRRNDVLLSDMAAALEAGAGLEAWFRDLFAWIFTRGFFDDNDAVAEAVRYAIDYPYPQSSDQFRRQVEAVLRFEPVDPTLIHARTLVVTGAEDLLFPPDEGRALSEAILDAGFVVIPHAAHAVHTERPGIFVETVSNYLLQG